MLTPPPPPRIAMRFNKSLLCSFLMLVLFGVGWTQTIYVDQNSTYDEQDGSELYPYHEVGAAVEHAAGDERVDTIIVLPGMYYENLSFEECTHEITLRSTFDPILNNIEMIESTIIKGVTNSFKPSIHISFCEAPINIFGLSITNGMGEIRLPVTQDNTWTKGGGICVEGDHNSEQFVSVKWCNIYENYAFWGGGIYGEYAYFTLEDSKIHDNALYFIGDEFPPDSHNANFVNGPRGAGLYIAGGISSVYRCKIFNNNSFLPSNHPLYNSLCFGNAAALVWRHNCSVGIIGITIDSCEIYENTTETHDEYMELCQWPYRCSIQLQRAQLYVEPPGSGSNYVEISNSTITDNRITWDIESGDGHVNTAIGISRHLNSAHLQDSFTNDIVFNNTAGPTLINQSATRVTQLYGGFFTTLGEWIPQIIPIKHCCVNDAHNAELYLDEGGGSIDANPLFVDHAANNYNLRWDTDVISPCIDAGSGEYNEGETPPDIGANPAIEHSHWKYSFEYQYDLDKWYWVSYPVLNTITDNALIANEFFEELLHKHQILENGSYVWTPTYLEEIRWVNQDQYSILWLESSNEWSDLVGNHPVFSPQGYKIKMQSRLDPAFSWPVTLQESGFKTPNNTQFPIYSGVENWLGYFREESQYPEDAFADIWDDLVSVRAKNWSIARDESSGLMIGKRGTLNYGDMVIVRTNNDHNSFQWGGNNPVPPDSKPEIRSFVYDEKPDYTPVYLSLSDSLLNDLDEIGLYLDGVCKGAVVVEDSLEQISAYVDSATELSEGNVEFVFYYNGSKSMGPQMKSMELPVGRLQPKYSKAGSAYPYFELKLSQEEMGNVVPPEFTLRQNYPNPFNPSTTITYSLAEDSKVRLDIYNVKGQLVKSLVNKDMKAGIHSVVWNGRDMNKQAVASGVYFYRLSSPSKTQTKRMLLMK
jgi:hypothetical protein